MTRRARRGLTTIELIVTLTILSLIATVATLALRRIDKSASRDAAHLIDDSLAVAVASASVRTIQFDDSTPPALVTVHPDGSVRADSTLHVDRLGGMVARAK